MPTVSTRRCSSPTFRSSGCTPTTTRASIAHARVYNDYVMERFTPYFHRLAPAAPIPLTDIDDAVAEIERVANAGFKAVVLPATAPRPYYSREFDPVWAAIQASGMSVFVHTQTGGVKVNDPEALTLKVMMENAQQVNQPMTERWRPNG